MRPALWRARFGGALPKTGSEKTFQLKLRAAPYLSFVREMPGESLHIPVTSDKARPQRNHHHRLSPGTRTSLCACQWYGTYHNGIPAGTAARHIASIMRHVPLPALRTVRRRIRGTLVAANYVLQCMYHGTRPSCHVSDPTRYKVSSAWQSSPSDTGLAEPDGR